jgi:methionyl aminopeptidase
MTVLLKDEIQKMRVAGKLAAKTLNHVGKFVRSGIKTSELDKIAFDFILSNGATPAPLGYRGYPKSVCTSVNDCICHGVPSDQILNDGDIVNVDITVIKDEFHGDTSRTFFVGEVGEKQKNITDAAYQAMLKGIEEVRPGATTGDIGFAINKYTTKRGYYVVREIGGHGIHRVFHDEPWVPSFGKKGRGEKLLPWICLTVEPMINETEAPIREVDIPGSDHKEYFTGDGSLTAQFEHTILVTDVGHEILTIE